MGVSSALQRAQGSERVQKQLGKLRRLRYRLVDVPLTQVERARRRLATEDVDVLLLGDSSTLSWALKDDDRTRMVELLGQRLGNVVPVCGPAFNSHIYAEAVRILSTMERRPKAVVFTSALRTATATHIVADPLNGYHRSLAALAEVRDARRPIRFVGRGGYVASEEDRTAFEGTAVQSVWSGWTTIGDYRKRIKGLGLPPWPIELERLRFDYFYGELLPPDSPRLDLLTTFAQRLEAYGVPAVGVWTRPPLQRGEMHFPGEFERHVRAQLDLHNRALARGSASIGPLLDIHVEDDEFEDSQNATEHYSYAGRVKFADAIAAAVRALSAGHTR